MKTSSARYALISVSIVAASVVGCSQSAPKTEALVGASQDGAKVVTVSDQWVKAADNGMTAVFGTLKNSGKQDVTVVSATSPAAGLVELHEVVTDPGGASMMRPKDGGFTIPAGGTETLAPGADHLMLMDLKAPLQVGSDIEVTLTFKDGSALPFTAQVRTFPGAGENYQPGGHPAGQHG
ncbi:MAG: copper chaperone PCu(A)C [Mycobacterium sp.]